MTEKNIRMPKEQMLALMIFKRNNSVEDRKQQEKK